MEEVEYDERKRTNDVFDPTQPEAAYIHYSERSGASLYPKKPLAFMRTADASRIRDKGSGQDDDVV